MEATMHQAKSQLSRLVKLANEGEEVILTRGRKRMPAAKLVPFEPIGEVTAFPAFKNGKRPIGLYKGQFEIGPEFFEPLPDEEIALWEGRNDDKGSGKIS